MGWSCFLGGGGRRWALSSPPGGLASYRAPDSQHCLPLLCCSALASDQPPLHRSAPPQKSWTMEPGDWLQKTRKMRAHVWRHPLQLLQRCCGCWWRVWTGCAGCQWQVYWSKTSSESGVCGSDSPCPATCPGSEGKKQHLNSVVRC